jgi:hypothetical protein
MEEKMNPLPKNHEHHFYPEGSTEKFYMSFQTTPSLPETSDNNDPANLNETQDAENPFQSKTWTKTTNSWV